ncbi:ribosome biogenesis factor YjgA [Moraxella sp.]|uniref:ribosome biogenesis factor YjgA n=1 Tax=Moraxella sp. TaxID=479 RepID=UPI0026DC471A|nr:ribosome biogenesis factor YjgA [Moraxella sp.]MDO4895093.1 ribosome biogenesis factor YjgA [Moraxella sp.]
MIDWSKQDMRVSRTEIKKAHERLQALATPLANLSKKQQKNLPVSEYFLDELSQLASITSAAAKNRQIKRVGKLIIEEDRHSLTQALFECKFTKEQIAKIETWYARLKLSDESTIKQFVKQFNASEFNSIYQLLLWIEYARHLGDDELLTESVADFESYVKEVAILST